MSPIANFLFWFYDWLLRVSKSQGGRTSNDRTTVEYANLVGRSTSSILVVSGKLMPQVYQSSKFLNAIDQAIEQGSKVEVLVGPKADPQGIKEYLRRGVNIKKLKSWPSRHFAVIDERHVRVEEPHLESSDQCVQYIIENFKDADYLIQQFRQMQRLI